MMTAVQRTAAIVNTDISANFMPPSPFHLPVFEVIRLILARFKIQDPRTVVPGLNHLFILAYILFSISTETFSIVRALLSLLYVFAASHEYMVTWSLYDRYQG